MEFCLFVQRRMVYRERLARRLGVLMSIIEYHSLHKKKAREPEIISSKAMLICSSSSSSTGKVRQL